MKPADAIEIIRHCFEADRYRRFRHFNERLTERGLVWTDVLAVIDRPRRVRSSGLDEYDRPRWIIGGDTIDGLPIEVVTVLDRDDAGHWTLLITIYHEA